MMFVDSTLKQEHVFKLATLAILGTLFLAISAVADVEEKKEDKEVPPVLSQISLIQEADLINSGALNSYNLTQIGLSTEQ